MFTSFKGKKVKLKNQKNKQKKLAGKALDPFPNPLGHTDKQPNWAAQYGTCGCGSVRLRPIFIHLRGE